MLEQFGAKKAMKNIGCLVDIFHHRLNIAATLSALFLKKDVTRNLGGFSCLKTGENIRYGNE
jgi:hypothetical protein